MNNKSNVLQGIRPSHLNALGVSNLIQKQKDVLLLITQNQKDYYIEIITLIISIHIEFNINYSTDFMNLSVIEFDSLKNEIMIYLKNLKSNLIQNLMI